MSDYIYGSSLRANSKANYLFRGDFRMRPNQNISSATTSIKSPALAAASAESASKSPLQPVRIAELYEPALPQPIFYSNPQQGSKPKSGHHNNHTRSQRKCITPEHSEMIKYAQQSWKGVERDYKKSVNDFIVRLDINGSPTDHLSAKQKQLSAKKKTATTSSPLLLPGSYHHTSAGTRDPSKDSRKDSFQPFDLETFWSNRILKRLTEEI